MEDIGEVLKISSFTHSLPPFIGSDKSTKHPLVSTIILLFKLSGYRHQSSEILWSNDPLYDFTLMDELSEEIVSC